eukprot:SAG11_NODE_721_length_7539_cov_32.292473_8_plen_188_part_00
MLGIAIDKLLVHLPWVVPALIVTSCCTYRVFVSRRLPRQAVDVLIVGSSVAAGIGATGACGCPCPRPRARGWASLLTAALEDQHGLSCYNAAVSGYNVKRTLARLQRALPLSTPQVVIVGLSLGNEGLPWKRSASAAEQVCSQALDVDIYAPCRRLFVIVCGGDWLVVGLVVGCCCCCCWRRGCCEF